MPWEPKTFIFRGYNPYIGGVKPSNFMVLGSHGGDSQKKMARFMTPGPQFVKIIETLQVQRRCFECFVPHRLPKDPEHGCI